MKILQINTSVNTGSTGRITEEIGQNIIENGFKSYIAARKVGPEGSKSHLIEIGNNWDTMMHGLKTRVLDKHALGSKRTTQDLIQKIDKIDPDAIGLHNLHGYYLNIEILFNYLSEKQKPVIWTLFDCWAFTGHCTYFDSIGCERWIEGCYSCPKKNKYPASYFLDHSKQNYAIKKDLFNRLDNLKIVTHSAWLANLVNRSFLNEYPVKIMPSGVNIDIFKPGTDYLPIQVSDIKSKIILGVASVWDERKGLADFKKLAPKLDENYQIVLVGLTEKQILDLPEKIIGIARTENVQELASLYSAADVFVNPTWQDNFPTTNIESLACGTPVITYNTGGSPEAVDENTGFVLEKGDLEGIAQSLSMISESNRNLYRKACRKRAVDLYNKDDRFQDYIELYKEMLGGR